MCKQLKIFETHFFCLTFFHLANLLPESFDSAWLWPPFFIFHPAFYPPNFFSVYPCQLQFICLKTDPSHIYMKGAKSRQPTMVKTKKLLAFLSYFFRERLPKIYIFEEGCIFSPDGL